MAKVVGVKIDGMIEWHASALASGPDYNTLCGLDAFDESIGHAGTVKAPKGQKIECSQCRNIFESFRALKLRSTDFTTK